MGRSVVGVGDTPKGPLTRRLVGGEYATRSYPGHPSKAQPEVAAWGGGFEIPIRNEGLLDSNPENRDPFYSGFFLCDSGLLGALFRRARRGRARARHAGDSRGATRA